MSRETTIKKPVLTEKSLGLAKQGWFAFEVSKHASKGQIKNAIESIFKVKVLKVRMLNISGKPKRWARVFGRTKSKTRALVKLKKGKINIFEIK